MPKLQGERQIRFYTGHTHIVLEIKYRDMMNEEPDKVCRSLFTALAVLFDGECSRIIRKAVS